MSVLLNYFKLCFFCFALSSVMVPFMLCYMLLFLSLLILCFCYPMLFNMYFHYAMFLVK